MNRKFKDNKNTVKKILYSYEIFLKAVLFC